VVLTVTVVVVINFRKFPYLATGWFWYLGTLVPVIGIVQVGSQSMADRYAYVPLIGLFIILVWGISDFIKERKFKLISGLAALTTVLFMTIAARHQVYYWKDTLALFSRALDVTKNNAFAHSNVAGELLVQNRIDEAMIHCEKALLLNPNDYNTLIRAARGYNVRGEQDKAIDALRRAIKLHPKQLRAYNDLYNLLMQNGKTSEALDVYANVLDNVKDNPDIYYRYGIILARHGRYHDSIDQFKQALRLRSNDADILTQMGMVLTFLGKKIDAIECFKEALKINPNHLPAHYQLAVIYKQEGLMNQFYHHQNEVIRINPAYKNQLF
jgi:tetratricopeptide (TPR) repeat protein